MINYTPTKGLCIFIIALIIILAFFNHEETVNSMDNYTLAEMGVLSWKSWQLQWSQFGPLNLVLPTFIVDMRVQHQYERDDLVVVTLVALLFTIHRYVFKQFVLKPIWGYLKLFPCDENKFHESSCKLLYYSFLYSWEYYLVNHALPHLRTHPLTHWQDYLSKAPILPSLHYLYLVEAGFYVHSIFATLFMDTWKKDLVVMLFHHVLALGLIVFSYIFRYHYIGLIVLYLHDCADIALEATNIVVTCNRSKRSMLFEAASTIGFTLFAAIWFYCRLYIYLRIVLFSSLHVSINFCPEAKFYFVFNSMLIALYLLNLYWFKMILGLAYRIATGTTKTIEDTRELYKHEDSNGNNNNLHTEEYNKHSTEELRNRKAKKDHL